VRRVTAAMAASEEPFSKRSSQSGRKPNLKFSTSLVGAYDLYLSRVESVEPDMKLLTFGATGWLADHGCSATLATNSKR
jgi:hypothetical protein